DPPVSTPEGFERAVDPLPPTVAGSRRADRPPRAADNPPPVPAAVSRQPDAADRMRVVRDLPAEAVRIGEIPAVATPRALLGGVHGCARSAGCVEHRVDLLG